MILFQGIYVQGCIMSLRFWFTELKHQNSLRLRNASAPHRSPVFRNGFVYLRGSNSLVWIVMKLGQQPYKVSSCSPGEKRIKPNWVQRTGDVYATTLQLTGLLNDLTLSQVKIVLNVSQRAVIICVHLKIHCWVKMSDFATVPFLHSEVERILRDKLPVRDGGKLTSGHVYRGAWR